MNPKALLFIAIGALVLGALFFVLKPEPAPPAGAPDPAPAPVAVTAGPASPAAETAPIAPPPQHLPPNTYELVIAKRALASGPQVIKVQQGDEVTLSVTADEVEEFHLHGYDLKLDLEPNRPGTLKFVADRSGRFEFELEKSRTDLGALEVHPK